MVVSICKFGLEFAQQLAMPKRSNRVIEVSQDISPVRKRACQHSLHVRSTIEWRSKGERLPSVTTHGTAEERSDDDVDTDMDVEQHTPICTVQPLLVTNIGRFPPDVSSRNVDFKQFRKRKHGTAHEVVATLPEGFQLRLQADEHEALLRFDPLSCMDICDPACSGSKLSECLVALTHQHSQH